jgi:hypothetical protein
MFAPCKTARGGSKKKIRPGDSHRQREWEDAGRDDSTGLLQKNGFYIPFDRKPNRKNSVCDDRLILDEKALRCKGGV